MLIDREVTIGNQSVGRVQVRRQGLYYVFRCRCSLSGQTLWYLEAACGEKRENLGVLVPIDGVFGLDTRRPVKNLGEGKIRFGLRPKRDRPGNRFAPIYPDEPFAYIQQLKKAFLETRPSPRDSLEAARFFVEAPKTCAGQESFWMMYAAMGWCRELVCRLDAEGCGKLRDVFDDLYPKRDRMPVQQELYKALKRGTGKR